MKYITLLSFFAILCYAVSAQDWQEYLPQDRLESGTITLADYQDAFQRYADDHNTNQDGYYYSNGEKHRLPYWKQFKRWEWLMQRRVDPVTGQFPQTDSWTEWNKYLERNPDASRSTYGNWVCLGPYTTPGGYNGLGRLNCVAFHPSDPNILWVGAPTGGIWKTISGGNSWLPFGENNEIMGVSDIIIPDDFATSNTIYIATGDRDTWRGTSIGVLKSTNGGSTWQPTDLQYERWDHKYVNRLVKHPGNDLVLYAATTEGIYKTTNGGVDFNLLNSVNMIDLEFHPTDPNIIYGSTRSNPARIYRTTDAGVTWFNELTISSGRRIELAVSPDEPAWVYALVSNQYSALRGVYRSQDNGDTWTLIYNGTLPNQNLLGWECDASDTTGQGGYDLSMAVNPNDALEVFIGGISTWKTTDGGVTWELSNFWGGDCGMGISVVHADKHRLIFRPGTTELFECSDGGLYKSLDLGNTWTDLSNWLIIGQIYRISTAQTVQEDILTGYQDVGSKLLSGGVWDEVGDADGMHNLIKPDDEEVQFCSNQNAGAIYRTFDHWENWVSIRPNIPDTVNGDWVTPFMLDPNNYNTLYVGLHDLWRSTDLGDNFTLVHDFPNVGGPLRIMDISPANSSRMVVANVDYLWKTINGGATWLDITNNLPVPIYNSRLVMDITYHNTEENTFWICLSSYDGHKVYKTTDNGSTFTNVSDGLPEVPTTCLVQNNLVTLYDELYCATEAGVFVKIGDQPWLPFNAGLPKVDCNWLTIYYNGASSRLRCGTWGRGVWESDLYTIGTGDLCIWDGSHSTDWWDANNWSFYTLPDANSYVGIPEGCPNYPVITGSYVTVKELSVYPGATLNIGANLVTVNESAHMYGMLVMSDNSSTLRVLKDLTWYAGSVVYVQGTSASIQVDRDLVCGSGTVLDFSNSTVFMGGSTYDSEIIINSPSITFNNITLDKYSSRLVTFTSTYGLDKLKVLGNFTIFPNNYFIFDSPSEFFLTGSFTNYGSFEFWNGRFRFAGGSTTIAGDTYCYFNDLIIDGTASTYLTLDFDATIAGDLELLQGSLDPLSNDLYILGDWNNQAGSNGFIQNTSNVIFKGADWQILTGTEDFHRLTLHTTGPGITIQDGTIECEEYDWTSGTLKVTTGGTFIAQELVDQAIRGNFNLSAGGNIELHSSTWIHLKGNVTISGGSFDVYGGILHSTWPAQVDASLTMSDGEFTFHDQGIYMQDNAYTLSINITGGALRSGGYIVIEDPDFDPSGGVVELIGTNAVHIDVDPGISLAGLVINKTATADNMSVLNETVERVEYHAADHLKGRGKKALPPSGNRSGPVTLLSDLDLLGSLTIENGELDIGAHSVSVGQDLDVYGTLIMTDPAAVLNVDQSVYWRTGSDATITDGDFSFGGDWVFEDGTNAQLTANNVLMATGTTDQTLTCNDDDAIVNLMAINNTSGVVNVSSSSQPFRIASNLVINDYGELLVDDSLWAGAVVNIQDLGTITVDGGDLHCNSWMLVYGTLNIIGNEDVRVMGNFTFGSDATLNLDAGNLYLDRSYTGSLIEFQGTVNLTGGMLHVTNEGIEVMNGSSFNFSSGYLRFGYKLKAVHPGTFHPTGGQTGVVSGNTSYIEVSNGNYLYDLVVIKDNSADLCIASDSVVLQGKLWVGRGDLSMQGNYLGVNGEVRIDEDGTLSPGSNGEVQVGGQWKNNHGDEGFNESTSIVEFLGAYPFGLLASETFYDLTINKTIAAGEYITVAIDDTLNVLNELQILDGALKLQQDCHLNVKHLTIANGAGLIAETLATGIKIDVDGNWSNANSGYTSSTGYNHQLSEVTFSGLPNQAVTSTGGEEFYRLYINKTNGNFNPANSLTILDSCCLSDGTWNFSTSGLNHYFHGDLEIFQGSLWWDSTCHLNFVGDGEQWLNSHMLGELKVYDLIVNQPVGDPDSKLIVEGNVKCRNWVYIPEGRMEVMGGTIRANIRLAVLAGGKFTGYEGTTIKMASPSDILLNGGDLYMIGTEADPCLITHQASGNYNFNVANAGYFEATWTTIEYPASNGVSFYSGGLADTNNGYQHCTFRNGITGGTLLKFNTSQDLEFHGVNFPDTPITGNYNVTKVNDAGSVTFSPAFGTFAGEVYEDDVFGRVFWETGAEWTGAVSTDWHTAGNWVYDVLPTSTMSVLIPDGTPHDPLINTAFVNINSILVESGATVTLDDYNLSVNEDADIYGVIDFTGNEDLTVHGDLFMRAGSDILASNTCDVVLYGDMVIEEGSNLNITGGYTKFLGADTARLICQEDSAALYQLWISKSPGTPFYFDGSSTGDLFINSFFYNQSGNIIHGDAPIKVYLNRSYINNGGHLYCDSTHFVFRGNAALNPFKMMPGDYLQDLTIQSTSHLLVDLSYSDTVNIKGDFEIKVNPSGTSGIEANGAYMLMEGNWFNHVGMTGFVHGESVVEFYNDEDPLNIEGENQFYGLIDNTSGPSSLTIYEYNEVIRDFNIKHDVTLTDEFYVTYSLRVQDPSASLTLSSGSYVEAGTLYQGGTITCNASHLYAFDIREDYLMGTYVLNGGYIEISQDISHTVNLGANITITDGLMAIYGGSGISKWPAQVNGTYPTLTMSGGQLFIASQGIEIEARLPDYSITENITGGNIRTSGHFYCRGTDTQFSPSGGVVEITGNTNTDCAVYDAGNALWDLYVNKGTGVSLKNAFEINIQNSLIIHKGIFAEHGSPVNIGPGVK